MPQELLRVSGHRVGMALPALAGRQPREMVGLQAGEEPASCCRCFCRGHRTVG